MQIKILCTRWGHENIPIEAFLEKVISAGYDGVDSWLPENKNDRKVFIKRSKELGLPIVVQQHQAKGADIRTFCRSFEYHLNAAMECEPVIINSHSGRDFFTINEQLAIIDAAENFSAGNNIAIAHETHRGRIGFSPGNAKELFKLRPSMKVTADFSHWVCVTESYLEGFKETVNEAIRRTVHIHARVGFPEGPQIPDPRLSEWAEPLNYFTGLWSGIIREKEAEGISLLTITTEFGPPPYMWTTSPGNTPVASQWEVNLFIMHLLRDIIAPQQ
ncbi:sugar phosphate isomerase/epimerase family protein [Chitinophaga ginsengisegetis]|uniref:sugar phosphate isomerase/epimerase family protein n=1 Tax=Chitinophaga ginsengisegetis TaxID=393003 RepID=UPI000DBA2F59|nr:sugar phosphate isomerase/epimerase [Chitinophaga ginsengisegetis]MDR6571267.1 sugar phosphate isomerase/epimerase [Chitinophaga ginsengisegetis]MDR6651001.1 sugar phosphate isomerase/epimerase [Chitinophaga ginsengisegetis]MDR6657351.1 sugar phosphate isomerase/epimerase [Chitinophaga ginsengisegetis]